MEKTWGGKEGEKEIKKEREKEEREREIKREKERERDLILSKVNIVTKYYDHQWHLWTSRLNPSISIMKHNKNNEAYIEKNRSKK